MPEAILWGLAQWALRATALAAVAGFLLWALRVKDVTLRLSAWTAVLLGALLIPVAVLLVPQLSIAVPKPAVRIELGTPSASGQQNASSVPNAPAEERVPATSSAAITRNGPAEDGSLPETTAAHAAPASRSSPTRVPLWPRVAIALWLAIAAVMLFKLMMGLWLSRRLVRGSREIEEGVRESNVLTVPVTVGLMRPVILLPPDWREWEEWKLQTVLTHEQSHVNRHDPLRQFAAAIYRSVCWFHPLAWWLAGKLAECAEAASDDAALEEAPGHVQYAEILLGFLERAPRRVKWAGIPIAKKETAAKRIDRILDSERPLSVSLNTGALVALAALATPLIYAAVSLRPVWAGAEQTSSLPSSSHTSTTSVLGQPGLKPTGLEHMKQLEPSGSHEASRSSEPVLNQKDAVKISISGPELAQQSNSNLLSFEQVPAQAQSLPAPLQISPADGSSWPGKYPRTIKLQWSEVPGAASYGIEVDCFLCCGRGQWCSDSGKLHFVMRGLREPTYTFDNFYGAQPGGWRVWGINEKSEDGPASPWWEFTFSPNNNLMRLPPLPANNAPPPHYDYSVMRVAAKPALGTAPRDGVVGAYGVKPSLTPEVETSSPPAAASSGVTGPKAIFAPDPEYTAAARKAKITGDVLLYVTVGTDGLVKQVSVTRSLQPDLDENAVHIVKTWRFDPARNKGVPFEASVYVYVSFNLY